MNNNPVANQNATEDRKRLLKRLQASDFALYDAALYLDGHPTDRKALAYYNKYKNMRNDLAAEYERKYGPLTIGANNSETTWYWSDDPWPWQLEFN